MKNLKKLAVKYCLHYYKQQCSLNTHTHTHTHTLLYMACLKFQESFAALVSILEISVSVKLHPGYG